MADLAAADVTYTVTKQKKLEDGRKIVHLTIAFGDGALTYPTGGVPLTKGKMGCPVEVDSFVVEDKAASGYSFAYDKSNEKLRMFQEAAHAHDLKIIGGQASTTDNEVGHYATNILGKEAATDATIAKADSATKGGVMSEAGRAGAELTNTIAPAAQTLKVTVIGW